MNFNPLLSAHSLATILSICSFIVVTLETSGNSAFVERRPGADRKDWTGPRSRSDDEVKAIVKEQRLDSTYKYYYKYGQLDGLYNLSEFSLMAVMSKPTVCLVSAIHIHSYDSFEDIIESGGPEANQELCLAQMTELVGRARQLEHDGYNSSDVNIFQLLDTFGRAPAGLFSSGDFYWPGIYHQCLEFTIRLKSSSQTGNPQAASVGQDSGANFASTRYCVASMRHNNWPRDDLNETLGVVKSGICLPKACDSLNYKNKFELIRRLLDTQARPMDRGNFYISDLYCLPDEQSSLRQFWRSPASLLTFVLLTSWIGVQVLATFWARKAGPSRLADDRLSGHALAGQKQVEHTKVKLLRCLSITNNISELFDLSEPYPRTESHLWPAKVEQGQIIDGSQACETVNETVTVNLKLLDGLKVICMNYLIVCHALVCLMHSVGNFREQANQPSLAYFIANVTPAFTVDIFFTITGLLTSYRHFKRHQHARFMSSAEMVRLIVDRYLRVMPMYLLVIIYVKTLNKYTGSGPFWDYGTTAMGRQKYCEQESLLVTLMYGANMKELADHCILTGWYLANDFQFYLITPILLNIFQKSPELCKRVLKFATLACFLAGFYSAFNGSEEDLRPIVMYTPYAAKLHSIQLGHIYTQPQYRISAYLIGLLMGLILHEFEQRQQNHTRSRDTQEPLDEVDDKDGCTGSRAKRLARSGWPESLRRYGPVSCAIYIPILLIAIPIILPKLPVNKPSARLTISLLMPVSRVTTSLAVGTYVLLASTGSGNPLVDRILSHRMWKPLSRSLLCATLCNPPILSYISGMSDRPNYINSTNLFGLNLICIIATLMVSIFLYILFENPMWKVISLLKNYLTPKKCKLQ